MLTSLFSLVFVETRSISWRLRHRSLANHLPSYWQLNQNNSVTDWKTNITNTKVSPIQITKLVPGTQKDKSIQRELHLTWTCSSERPVNSVPLRHIQKQCTTTRFSWVFHPSMTTKGQWRGLRPSVLGLGQDWSETKKKSVLVLQVWYCVVIVKHGLVTLFFLFRRHNNLEDTAIELLKYW